MSLPDENIHPNATGEAADIVAAHQDPQELVFYSGWFCPYVQRSWIALEEKGIPYQYKEVNPYKKEKHFLAINPKGLVPAIEYHGKALYESLVICEFLEDAYPNHKPHLLPIDPFQRATARLWVDSITKSVVPSFMRLMQAQEKDKQEVYLQEFTNALRTISAKRVPGGPYFFGETFSLVDIAIAPWVMRDYNLADHRGYKREDAGQNWVEWASALENRESVKKTFSEKQYFVDIYERYLRNEAQSEAAKATRAGRIIP